MPPLCRYDVDTVEGAIWLPCLLFGLCAGRFNLCRMCNGTEQMESSNHCCHCRRAGEYVRPLETGRKETCNVPDLSNHNKSSTSQLHLNLTRASNVNSYQILAIVWEPPSLGLLGDMQMKHCGNENVFYYLPAIVRLNTNTACMYYTWCL